LPINSQKILGTADTGKGIVEQFNDKFSPTII